MTKEPVPMSDLGGDCSNYLDDKDGLELWLTFVDSCFRETLRSCDKRQMIVAKYQLCKEVFGPQSTMTPEEKVRTEKVIENTYYEVLIEKG